MRRFFAFFSVALSTVAIVAACDSSIDLGRGGDAGASEASSSDATSEFSLPTAAPTCESTCLKAAACGFVEEGKMDACIADCPRQTTPDIRRCVQQARCEDILGCAGVPEGGADVIDPITASKIEGCKSSCTSVHFYGCCSASELEECQTRCTTAPSTKRDSFDDCATGSQCPKLVDCLEVFLRP